MYQGNVKYVFHKKDFISFCSVCRGFFENFPLVFYKSGREKDPGMLPEPLQS